MPISKGLTFQRVAGSCGVLCPVVVFISIRLATAYAPWFSWTANGLSDLAGMAGETPTWVARGTASVVFNSSLIVVGILAFLFAIGLRKTPQLVRGIGSLGRLLFILGVCALFAMGIFPRTMGLIHEIFSVSFFVLIPASLILMGMAMLRSFDKRLGYITVTLGIIGLCPLFIPWPWEGEAIPDMISILAMMAFAIIFGTKLLKRTTNVTL